MASEEESEQEEDKNSDFSQQPQVIPEEEEEEKGSKMSSPSPEYSFSKPRNKITGSSLEENEWFSSSQRNDPQISTDRRTLNPYKRRSEKELSKGLHFVRLETNSSIIEFFGDDIDDEKKRLEMNNIYFFQRYKVNFSASQYIEFYIYHMLGLGFLGPLMALYPLFFCFKKKGIWCII